MNFHIHITVNQQPPIINITANPNMTANPNVNVSPTVSNMRDTYATTPAVTTTYPSYFASNMNSMHSVNEGYRINTQPQSMARDSVVHGNAESHPKMFKHCEICGALMHTNSGSCTTLHCPRNRMNHKK